jgi:hypothetical protein
MYATIIETQVGNETVTFFKNWDKNMQVTYQTVTFESGTHIPLKSNLPSNNVISAIKDFVKISGSKTPFGVIAKACLEA